MANISPKPVIGSLKVPINYPTKPEVGKIRILFDANSRELYHRLSPYGFDSFAGFTTSQPFLYTYPDEFSESSRFMPDFFPKAADDVVRVSKFLISPPGLLFLGKQFLLQTGNAFNETRIYNPLSPVLAAAMPLTLWTLRPQRFIDISSLAGIVGSFLGPAVGSIFGSSSPPPAGTVGQGGLSAFNPNDGKGLTRAGTANPAKSLLVTKWTPPSSAGLGLGGFISGLISGLIGNFLPQRQQNVQYRSDELAYGLMIGVTGGSDSPFAYQGATTPFWDLNQFWIGGSRGSSGHMRQGNTYLPANWKEMYVDEDGLPVFQLPSDSITISGIGQVGWHVSDASVAIKYGDYIGITHNDDWANSNMLVQFSMYSDTSKNYTSKFTDVQEAPVVAMQKSLQKVIDAIGKSKLYTTTTLVNHLLPTINGQVPTGYDRITQMKAHGDVEVAYRTSMLQEYDNTPVLENQHTRQPAYLSRKMASTNQFDGINTLTVLDGTKAINNPLITDWTTWQPYKDDLIAFYFYDLVNDKYVPFRATIKGLQETDTANWEELTFIGRADRTYSYSGYNRSLTFNFTVHINSIIELSPTWQRINYLMSLVKPSSYTKRNSQTDTTGNVARYMVPPMVLLNIGDMYKNQPIVIGSAGISIPEWAIWETQNEENTPDGWSYLANYIKAPSVGKLYSQLPRTAEISINAYILERERAIVGGANFGAAVHDDSYTDGVYIGTGPKNTQPTEMDKSLVVYNYPKSVPYVGDVNAPPTSVANTA